MCQPVSDWDESEFVSKPSVNPYYGESGSDRASRVRALFDRIAPRYDLVNDVQSFGLHRFWKRRLIRQAQLKKGEKALDVCCGTGDITLSIARQGLETIGVDFSPGMLEQARRRNSASAQATFIEADALKLPFGNDHFDLLTIAYGLRNIEDFEAGLRELARVLKPGGRMLVLDFGKPDNRLWRRLYFGYLGWMVPLFGSVFCGDSAAYSYILESLKHYPAQQGVADQMKSMGFEAVKIDTILGGVMSINQGRKAAAAPKES